MTRPGVDSVEVIVSVSNPNPPPGDPNGPPSLYGNRRKGRFTIRDLARAKQASEPWAMLTAYDAMTAGLFEECGIPALLVGDSAAMVVQGHGSTLPITVDDLIMLTSAVVRGTERALVVADLPFGSYQESPRQALRTATRFMKESGAQAVKLEGGRSAVGQISAVVEAGIPVMAHVGLTPQSVNALGGYRVQGRGDSAQQLVDDALAVQDAGAFAVVLEVVPQQLAEELTARLSIPTIGIGAGAGTDAQVLVWQDLLGLTAGRSPKFVKPYADLRSVMSAAVRAWSEDVHTRDYPDTEHAYD